MAPQSPVPVARLGFNEAMAMTRLPAPVSVSPAGAAPTDRFISRTPAWRPGQDLPESAGATLKQTYGGHVFIQAALGAARVVEKQERGDEEEADGASAKAHGKLGIHSVQGVFTLAGLSDRPFLYDVADVNSSKSFSTKITTARQPAQPSSNPSGPFPESDAGLPLGGAVFTCITTFKRPSPSPSDVQQHPSPWTRFADILRRRAPDQWPVVPQVDLDTYLAQPGNAALGHGSFPIVDLHKVDMTAYNAGRPLPERRELILYRLLHGAAPLLDPADVNAHALCHAFAADRNGLLMLMRHQGWGHALGQVASLSLGFFVHTNADEAVMREGEWWLHEVCWPRASAGRGMMESRIWSPDGRHVASAYQDGLCKPFKGRI